MITRADKGTTTVIIDIEDYNSKTLDLSTTIISIHSTPIPPTNFKRLSKKALNNAT